MKCECGQTLKIYIVTVDEEQYIENLCPRCAFPRTDVPEPPDFTRSDPNRQLTLEMIDDTVAELNTHGVIGKALIVSWGTLKKLSEEFEILTQVVAPPSLCKQLVSGGHILDIKVSSTLPDGEAVIADSKDNWHPILPFGIKPTGASILKQIKDKSEIFKMIPKRPFTKTISATWREEDEL